MIQNLKAVVFDFDGTLVDASPAICLAFNTVLANHGAQALPEEDIRGMIGRPLREMFARVFPDASPTDIEVCIQGYRDTFMPVSVKLTRPLPGLHQVVPRLSAGMELAIATSRTVRGAVHILEGLGLVEYFTTIVGVETVTHAKPHAEPVMLALERVNVSPERAVMVGDTPDDMAAGRAAGTATIGISTDPARRRDLEAAGADYVIGELGELIALIDPDVPPEQ